MRCCLRVAGSLLVQGCTMHNVDSISTIATSIVVQLCCALFAGLIRAMNQYMPVMPAVTADKPSATDSSPHLPQLKKRMGPHGKSAFKQTTLMFGKKPKITANMGSSEVVDLSDM